MKGLEHKSENEQLKETEVFRLGKRRLMGDITTLYDYLTGGYREVEALLLQEPPPFSSACL